MQAHLLKVNLPHDQSILYHSFRSKYFYDNWHFHPELELFYVEKGDGLRLVGDGIERFESGDLVLLGPNIPHVWKCDARYYDPQQETGVAGIVIQLPEHFMHREELDFHETAHIADLLQKSRFGLKFEGESAQRIRHMILQMETESSFHRLISILEILNLMASSDEYRLLSTPGFISAIENSGSDRINRVFEYILQNFTGVIKLEEVSELLNLTPTSFCRYFKRHTQKTFTRYLNEVRVSYACKLLREGNLKITTIAYECGFQNQSNFNRQFKKLKGISPGSYALN